MNIGFRHHKVGRLEYLTIPAFENAGLVAHCFTTRLGGVSTGECETLNMGLYRNDIRENVMENYRIITKQVGIDYNGLVFSNQVHDDKIADVTDGDRGMQPFGEGIERGIDGLITDEPDVPLITFYADCVPLFFLDPVQKVIALVHSGWRGTVKQIGKKAIGKMINEYGCRAEDILTAIGPSIGKCHFEVDRPVAEAFYKAYGPCAKGFIEEKQNGKYHIDLWTANILQFKEIGIRERNITLAQECTCCNRHIYFSHRGNKGKTGSLAAIMMLKKVDG
ncbi:MAG: peptidoglycan editing factor PgeF [Firmicutes bacterium]|nr:peptidoglycan editing factor PgeF [Bacillota bacterium]